MLSGMYKSLLGRRLPQVELIYAPFSTTKQVLVVIKVTDLLK